MDRLPVSLSRPDIQVVALPSALEGNGNRLPGRKLAQKQLNYLHGLGKGKDMHWFFPYLNPFMEILASNPRDSMAKVTTSGILFSPATSVWSNSRFDWLEKLRSLREIYRLRHLQRRANLSRLFVLNDKHTALRLNHLIKLPEGVHSLVDPVASSSGFPASSRPLGRDFPSQHINFLLLGALRSGKGVAEALREFGSWVPPEGKVARLTLAGAATASFETELQDGIANFQRLEAPVELVLDLGFLSTDQIARHLDAADYVLLPYLRPLGSSGLLGHAARANKPVLACRGGLIGKLVREYGLGETFDPRKSREWRSILNAAVLGKVSMNFHGAKRYLKTNSIEAFQKVVFDHLLGDE